MCKLGLLSVRAHDVMTGGILDSTVPGTTISDLVLLKTFFFIDSELHFIDDDKIQVLRFQPRCVWFISRKLSDPVCH